MDAKAETLDFSDLFGRIEIAQTDGTGRQVLREVGRGLQGVAVDITVVTGLDDVNHKIYSESRVTSARGTIFRFNFDGSDEGIFFLDDWRLFCRAVILQELCKVRYSDGTYTQRVDILVVGVILRLRRHCRHYRRPLLQAEYR